MKKKRKFAGTVSVHRSGALAYVQQRNKEWIADLNLKMKYKKKVVKKVDSESKKNLNLKNCDSPKFQGRRGK